MIRYVSNILGDLLCNLQVPKSNKSHLMSLPRKRVIIEKGKNIVFLGIGRLAPGAIINFSTSQLELTSFKRLPVFLVGFNQPNL